MTERNANVRCPHFGDCGGCRLQDLPYASQLATKEATLRETFSAYWDGPIPVMASPSPWRYRNKVDFTFGRMHYPEPPPKGFVRESVLGFKKRGRWYWPMPIEDCHIGPEGVGPLLAAVRNWMNEDGLRAFDSRTHDGLLRILLVREGLRTQERMVVLITADGEFDKESFVEAVRRAYPATSIYHGVFRGLADVAAADELELLWGTPAIDEKLVIPDGAGTRELHFRISPFSFFQVNPLATELLYGEIRQWARRVAPATLYDLYGGAGGIALTCADLVEHVESVENVEAATLDGRHNAEVNGVGNVRFTTDKVKNYLKWTIRDGGLPSNSAVITDPPRSGMVPKAVRRLIELRPKHILYVSCKNTVFARDELPLFAEHYDLTELKAVDMFPHTPHVEVLAALTLRGSSGADG